MHFESQRRGVPGKAPTFNPSSLAAGCSFEDVSIQDARSRLYAIQANGGDRAGLAVAHQHLAAALENHGNLVEAEEHLAHALTLLDETSDGGGALLAVSKRLARLDRRLGRQSGQYYERAAALLCASLRRLQESGAPLATKIDLRFELAETYRERGLTHQAEQIEQSLLRELMTLDVADSAVANRAFSHGEYLENEGFLDRALMFYTEATCFLKRGAAGAEELGPAYADCARVELKANHPAEARRFAAAALKAVAGDEESLGLLAASLTETALNVAKDRAGRGNNHQAFLTIQILEGILGEAGMVEERFALREPLILYGEAAANEELAARNYEGARVLVEELDRIGPSNGTRTNIRWRLARAFSAGQDPILGEKLMRQVVAVIDRPGGERDRTAAALLDLARACLERFAVKDANALLQRALILLLGDASSRKVLEFRGLLAAPRHLVSQAQFTDEVLRLAGPERLEGITQILELRARAAAITIPRGGVFERSVQGAGTARRLLTRALAVAGAEPESENKQWRRAAIAIALADAEVSTGARMEARANLAKAREMLAKLDPQGSSVAQAAFLLAAARTELGERGLEHLHTAIELLFERYKTEEPVLLASALYEKGRLMRAVKGEAANPAPDYRAAVNILVHAGRKVHPLTFQLLDELVASVALLKGDDDFEVRALRDDMDWIEFELNRIAEGGDA